MIDPRIVRFIGRHHVLTLATVAGEQPYCSHAFYAYDPERNLLVFAADKTTRHAEEMQANRQVALGIALESKAVGKLQGLQLCGTVREADEEARKTYIRRFPVRSTRRADVVGCGDFLHEIHGQYPRIRKETDMEQQGTGVIIVAGGSGSRLGGPLPKQFRMLGSLPVLGHAINAFARTLHSTQIVVVLPEGQIDFWKNLAARFDIAKHTCTAGGLQRFHSVRNGLSALPRTVALIAVHDGVRPLVSSDLILKAVECAAAHGTAIPVVEAVDSLRQLTPDGSHPINRNTLRIVQTPQVFDAELLRRAYELDYSPDFTDDASVVERAGHAVTLCHGERGNLKITTADDLPIAEAILLSRASREENL